MSANREETKRWSGYVCPDCRFVFRVPQEHDGKGLVCPGCRRLLRIPRPDEETAPLVLRAAEIERVEFRKDPGDEGSGEGEMRRRRVKKRHSSSKRKGEGLNWEADGTGRAGRVRSRERRWMRWAVIAGGTGLLVTLIALLTQLNMTSDPVPSGGQDGASEVAQPNFAPDANIDKSLVEDGLNSALLAAAEPLARAFLEAETVDEMAKVVRNPDIALPRMHDAHPSGRVEPPGMAEFNYTGAPEIEKGRAAILIRTRNYESKRLDFVETPDGLKIDWESWSGWCEMDWDQFVAERPTDAKLFRVLIRKVDYYNYDFSDESKWRSYRMESLDGERMLYGYVERASAMDEKLQLDPDFDGEMMMLKLRFPETESVQPQVLIEDVVQKGWVEFLPAENPAPDQP